MIVKKEVFVRTLLKTALAVSFLGIFSVSSHAQYYNGIGARFGGPGGITFKRFFDNNNANAIELIFGSDLWLNGRNGFSLTGLYEAQRPIMDSRMQAHLDWFIGLGGHVGVYSWDNRYVYDRYGKKYNTGTMVAVGIDGIIGLEYKMPVPFTIGIDIKPYFDIIPASFAVAEGALTIRYVWGN